MQQLKAICLLIRLHRPIGTLLLLWPTLWALWIAAAGVPDIGLLAIFILGTFVMRSAGCAINDYADRKLDAKVSRTRNRPLATGALSPKVALVVCFGLLLVAFALVALTNRLTIYLSLVGGALALLYPFAKRFTDLPQLVLGIAFNWGVPMAYAAQLGYLTEIVWWLYAAAVCWTLAYDTIYALVDRPDDLLAGARSSAIFFGRFDLLAIGLAQLAMLLLLAYVGYSLDFSAWFWAGWVGACALSGYQQYAIRGRDPEKLLRVFGSSHLVGMAIFIGIALHYQFAT